MNKENEEFIKSNLLKYSYYDDNKDYVVIIDDDYLKKLFKADVIAFKETY